MSSAEQLLRKLRKLEANMKCPNCETAAPHGVGFGNVCVKFKTFVCDLCKTSHQAISHRVKSITMSNWTMDEVNELTDKFGGGNAAALHIWLGKAPRVGQRYPGGARPKEGDRIEIFKQFVLDAYEYGKFRADTPYIPGENSIVSSDNSPITSKASSPVPAKRNGTLGTSLENSRTSSPATKLVAPPTLKSNSSFDNFGSSTDPFQSSFSDQGSDPFGFPTTSSSLVKPPVASKKVQPVQQKQEQPNLIDFSEPTPSQASSTKSSVSLLDALGDLTFGTPVPLIPPVQQQKQYQQQQSAPMPPPSIPVSSSFDPFGSDLLTPIGSGSSSPARFPQQQFNNNTSNPGITHSTSNPNLAASKIDASNNWQNTPQYSSPVFPAASVSNNNGNNILDLFSGMTYDSTPGNSMNGQAGSNNSNWVKPVPTMHSANAISQIDVFASMNNNNKTPAYGVNGGRWNNSASNSSYAPRPPIQPTRPVNSSAATTGDKFDFLQDTMKQHLSK